MCLSNLHASGWYHHLLYMNKTWTLMRWGIQESMLACSKRNGSECFQIWTSKLYAEWQKTFHSRSWFFSTRQPKQDLSPYRIACLTAPCISHKSSLGGLSLPRKSVVRLTDHPDMTLDVYLGRKTTTQQQQQHTVELKKYQFIRN